MRVTDLSGRVFDIELGPRTPYRGGYIQQVWITDDQARTLQVDQVAALDACPNPELWDGWEQVLKTVP